MNDTEKKLAGLLMILLKRAGGTIAFTDEERAWVKGNQLIYEEQADAAQLTYLHLIPDYVATGVEEEPEEVSIDETLEEIKRLTQRWGNFKPQFGNGYATGGNITGTITGSWPKYDPTANVKVYLDNEPVGMVTNVSTTGSFEMKMTRQGWDFAQRMSDQAKRMFSIGSIGAEHKENTSMGDTPKAPEQPAPPDGGGIQTTDPTFANQGGSAPKENKPAKKSDVTRKR